MKNKITPVLIILLFLFITTAFAFFEAKPQVRVENKYRYDTRQDNHALYITRVSAAFNYLDALDEPIFKFIPFFESRLNLGKDFWERKEIGIEIGKDIFPFLYLGESLQQVWMKEDYRYYSQYESRDQFEAETRLMLKHDLISNDSIKLKCFVANEYTYDFNNGKGVRNEIVGGFVMPFGKHIETDLVWRHIDRIHHYDSDVVETSITLIF